MTDSVETVADYVPPPAAAAVPMQAHRVSLVSVVTHPANPRRDLGDLTELEESIRELGVLQPPVVLPAARVAAAWPQHAAELAAAEWVVLMGARRRTAAGRVYGDNPDATLNVLVREDSIADDPGGQLDVMTTENTARSPLTPMEEARAFAFQRDAGRSQREIAARMGCSQANVSKRLKLLALPEPRSRRQGIQTGLGLRNSSWFSRLCSYRRPFLMSRRHADAVRVVGLHPPCRPHETLIYQGLSASFRKIVSCGPTARCSPHRWVLHGEDLDLRAAGYRGRATLCANPHACTSA
ncbi:ParB N-terminal domain-containing protein [Micromonospora sp. KC721]|uniref:ParB/RepB/Spo0J family partition protein n=1 Tax=Micromonospora sp. KC721 TaxID=2530380 RepID=UPI00104454E3|nr:ParB N-terminal domain-containing protein [Micromonospora sp. KC721]TDB80223.1 hypothetical protein E1182_09810 [Micromonospora sp. KC721]